MNRIAFLTAIATVVLIGGGWMLFGRQELVATFTVDPYTIDIYAENERSYEPPGYIYFVLKKWGRSHIAERRFMGVGPERKPRGDFTLIKTNDKEIVALVLSNEVQMIHEFESGFTWPGPYTNVTEPQWEMAELLLQKLLADNPGIRCPRQERYRKKLDRDQPTRRTKPRAAATTGC